jgi:hypothetical protein
MNPTIQRLLDDDDVHDRLGDAAKHVRDAAVRARKLPADRAVTDKKVYDNLRRALADVSSAVRRAQKPPKAHGKRTLVLAIAAGVGAAAVANRFGA